MGASKDDVLDVDNLRLIYYSTLAGLSFKGATVEGFSPDRTSYTVEGDISTDAAALAYAAKGAGATCSMECNAADGIATITVSGGDITVNPDNKTVYTVRFVPSATGISSATAGNAAAGKAYTIGGVRAGSKTAKGVYVVDGKKVVLK